jgi:hypothetical protein
LSDQAGAAAIATYALDMGDDANRPAGYAGVTVDDSGTGMLATVALGNSMLEDTPNVRRSADFIGMNTADWLALTRYTSLDLPAFLALLGVKPGPVPAVVGQFAAGAADDGLSGRRSASTNSAAARRSASRRWTSRTAASTAARSGTTGRC